MLRGVQANVAQRRALSQLYQAKGVALGTVDAVSDITLWPKPSCIPAKGDPLGEGSNASSTNNELWLQRERHAHR